MYELLCIFFSIFYYFETFLFPDNTFIVHDVKMIPLYDPPHLLKCIRNNLADKNLEFQYPDQTENTRKFANWEHIIIAYEIDIHENKLDRTMRKLTDRHVFLNKMKKMSVKHATQVLSRTFAAYIKALAGGKGRNL